MNEQSLVSAALDARKQAYCPYSGFAVGAALLCADQSVFWGCNIENAAFTPSNCAERTAFFEAVKLGHRTFEAIAVAGGVVDASLPLPVCAPCGVCLQVMAEFCDPDRFQILLVQDQTKYTKHSLRELLPYGFSANTMK